MVMQKLSFRSIIKKPASEVLNWHLRDSSLTRSIPPWETIFFHQTSCKPNEQRGEVKCRTKVGPFTFHGDFHYDEYHDKEHFSLVQRRGLFTHFKLVTEVIPLEERSSELVETLEYELPTYAFWIKLDKRLERVFRYKHALIQQDLDIFERYPYEKPKKILLTGSHGFVGRQLTPFLECLGHEVTCLVRSEAQACRNAFFWDPDKRFIEREKLEGFDAVIHLAGENIMARRWTPEVKGELMRSRCQSTDFLVKALCELRKPPEIFLCASAVGYYGDAGDVKVDESSGPRSHSFLSEICKCWEEACLPLKSLGTRVANMRFGMVLSRQGGALKRLLPIFKMGIGGRLGSGEQMISWIALDDLLAALYHILMTPDLEGPFNFSAPGAVNNETFSKELSLALHRWRGPPVPAFLLHLLLGQRAEEVLLSGARAEPKKLIDSGFFFRYPTLKQAFAHVL